MFRFTDLIIFRVTRDCNLSCKYCFMKEKHKHKGEIIDLELFKKIIQRIIKQRIVNHREKMNLSFVLHGGEALIIGAENLYKMLEYMKTEFMRNGIQHSIACQTNATLLDDDIIKTFQKFEVTLGLSFDGINGANKNRTDIKQEVFENKFDLITENKVPFSFITVVGKNNVDTIHETQEYLLDMAGTPEYKMNYVEDMDNPGEESEIELTGEEIFEKIWKPELEKFLKEGYSREWHIKNLLNKTIVDIITYHDTVFMSGRGCFGKYCGTGMSMIAVEPDGEMDLCDRYSKSFPEAHVQHALDYDFLGLHQIHKVLEHTLTKIDYYKEIGCDTCYASYICEYGCPTFYYSKHGKYGVEQRIVCDQFKKIYDYVLKHIEYFIEVYFNKYNEKIFSEDIVYGMNLTMCNYINNKGFDLQLQDDKRTIIIKKVEK